MPLLSVIVPVYQSAAYLERCVSSILGQSIDDLELLLIDDGSTDGSGELCDRLAGADSRIRVLHQENSGVSAARNMGIAAAKGKYVQFVDSDDTIGADYSGELVKAAEDTGAELVIAGYTTCLPEREIQTRPESEGCQSIRSLAEEFERLYFQVLLNSPVNKLYRRELIRRAFPPEMKMGEDLVFNMEYLSRVERVAWRRECGYFYNKENESSATFSRVIARPEDLTEYALAVRRFLERYLSEEESGRVYDRVLFVRLCTQLNSLSHLGGKEGRLLFRAAVDRPEIREMLDRLDARGLPMDKRLAALLLRHGGTGLLWRAMKR